MPKARKRNKGTRGGSVVRPQPVKAVQNVAAAQKVSGGAASSTTLNRPFLSPVVRGPQSLVFPGMVMLGCWLMAFTLIYFSTDPNHILFGGMAFLMGLLWTFSFGIRVRKLLLQRSRV